MVRGKKDGKKNKKQKKKTFTQFLRYAKHKRKGFIQAI